MQVLNFRPLREEEEKDLQTAEKVKNSCVTHFSDYFFINFGTSDSINSTPDDP